MLYNVFTSSWVHLFLVQQAVQCVYIFLGPFISCSAGCTMCLHLPGSIYFLFSRLYNVFTSSWVHLFLVQQAVQCVYIFLGPFISCSAGCTMCLHLPGSIYFLFSRLYNVFTSSWVHLFLVQQAVQCVYIFLGPFISCSAGCTMCLHLPGSIYFLFSRLYNVFTSSWVHLFLVQQAVQCVYIFLGPFISCSAGCTMCLHLPGSIYFLFSRLYNVFTSSWVHLFIVQQAVQCVYIFLGPFVYCS